MREGKTSLAERFWRSTSLVQRLTFVALMPMSLTALLLFTLLTRHQLETLNEMGSITADAIARQAASSSAEPLRNMQRRELGRIATSISHLPHVTRVQIRAMNGEIVADQSSDADTGAGTTTVIRDIASQPDGPAEGSVLVEVSLADAIAAQDASLRHALGWLAATLLLAALIGWQSARWISAPLRRLAIAVQKLGHGERGVVVAVSDDTEIGNLQQGFNTASLKLEDAQRRLESEIAYATTELARKNDALEAASVAKARFLAAASHDLRQPLYALTLFSSGLAVDEHDPARLDRIAHIQECVEALDHLFSELLDLSRLETGAMQTEFRDFCLDDVFEEVSRNFRMIAEQHELRLVVRKTEVWVRSDRTMLARILNNLVSNALRYTRRGGVLVAARMREGGMVRVDVWDTGNGIAAEHQERVFEEFFRIDGQTENGRHDAAGRRGLGLGLATVQRLADLLGTRVAMRSKLGTGSVFSFVVPETEPLPSLPSPMSGGPELLDIAGMRVLVVDDEPAILSGIRFLLGSWGCDVAVARDREQALDAAEAWPRPPDMVICDLRLQDGSGLDTIAALDRHYRRREGDPPPFARLLITGETRSDRLREIHAVRIPVLYKPVSPEQLREVLMTVRNTVREIVPERRRN
jgi:signal transduction histidine kinase